MVLNQNPGGSAKNDSGSSFKSKNCLAEGIYDYHSSYNFDAYLEGLGVPWYLRSLARFASPIVTISKLEEKKERY